MNRFGITMLFPKRYDVRALGLGDGPVTLAAWLNRFAAIWAAQEIWRQNRTFYESLRRYHPEIAMYAYAPVCTSRPPGKSGMNDYGLPRWAEIEAHPEWLVRRDMGLGPGVDNAVIYDLQQTYPRYLLDVTNPDCREYIASELVHWARGETWNPPITSVELMPDGLAADNVMLGAARLAKITARGEDYANWQFHHVFDAVDWNRGMCELLRTVRDALEGLGMRLVANHSLSYADAIIYGDNPRRRIMPQWWRLYESVDGLMTESPLAGSWTDTMDVHQATTDAGYYDWWTWSPDESEQTLDEFMFHYCSYLLVYAPGKSLFHATWVPGMSPAECAPWHATYDRYLGEPLGRREQCGCCWKRQFRHATVFVNPTYYPQRLSGADNWASAMLPRSGVIVT